MAKIAFGKLQLTKNTSVNTIDWNGISIEVIQYLPTDDKTAMFERVLNSAVDDNGYYNITKINFWLDLEILFTYTNISFTEKQKEDLFKLYDLVKGNGLLKAIKEAMNQDELTEIIDTVWGMVKNIYQYHCSALGIMKMLNTDYSNLNLEADEIKSKIADPENLTLLKDVLTKLG